MVKPFFLGLYLLFMTKIINHNQGFTFLELLLVVAIIAILSAVAYPIYSGHQVKAKINAATENHNSLVSFLTLQAQRCATGMGVEMATTGGNYRPSNCPSITAFRLLANAHVYGTFKNPYPPSNGSRCRPNVDNCSPPGYLGSCSLNGKARYGMMAIIVKNSYELFVCTNIGPKNSTSTNGVILQNTIRYVPNDLKPD